MSASQDASQKFHQYDSDDRQLLVGLLHEYSEKLIEISRLVAQNRRTNEELSSGFLIIAALCITFSYLFWKLFVKYLESTTGYTGLGLVILDNLVLIIVFTSLLLFLVVGVCVLKFSSFPSPYESDRRERDARMIASRLESAMRLTVEIADQVEPNLARKLELDLRIDDASSALDYYYSVVNLKSKSKLKSRKLAP